MPPKSASIPKKRATLPEILRKHSLVSVYAYPGKQHSSKLTKIGDATIIDRKKSKDTQGSIKYYDVTLKWVVSNATRIAALKGLANLPKNMQEVIMKQALPKRSNGYPTTIKVEYAQGLRRNSRFAGSYVTPERVHTTIVFSAPSDNKEIQHPCHNPAGVRGIGHF